MKISIDEIVEILEKTKSYILEKDKFNAYKSLIEYEFLTNFPQDFIESIALLFIHLGFPEKGLSYLINQSNHYALGRFYLHFGFFQEAYLEFCNWAKKRNVEGIEIHFLFKILFIQRKYNQALNLINDALLLSSKDIAIIVKNEKLFSTNLTDVQLKNDFVKGIIAKNSTRDFFHCLVISLILEYKITNYLQFKSLITSNYKGIAELLEYKHGIENSYYKYLDKNHEKIIANISIRMSSWGKITNFSPIECLDSLIRFEKANRSFKTVIFINDPIVRIIERYLEDTENEGITKVNTSSSAEITSFFEINEGNHYHNINFKDFEKSVVELLNNQRNYLELFDHSGLLSYYILSNNLGSAIDLIRREKVDIHRFVLLTNLLILLRKDFKGVDILNYPFVFFNRPQTHLSKKLRDNFINFLDNKIIQIAQEKKTSLTAIYKQYCTQDNQIESFFPVKIPTNLLLTSPFHEQYGLISHKFYRLQSFDDLRINYSIHFNNIEIEFSKYLGLTDIGLASLSERLVYFHLKNELPDTKITIQYSPIWLKPQRFDFYIEELNLAIEYQGEQHFFEIEYFGGHDGFEDRIENDERKRNLSKINNVNLEYILHNEDILEKIKSILLKYKL